MKTKIWNAAWVCAPEFLSVPVRDGFHKEVTQIDNLPAHKADLQDHHMFVRKVFHLAKLEQRYILDISADDGYRLHINGVFIGEGPANSYYFRYRYDHLDITEYLQNGTNVIAVQVYYQGLTNPNRVWISGDYRQGLIAELMQEDGRVIVKTDASWKMHCPRRSRGHIIGYDTQFAENIDSRSWLTPEWRQVGYDDSGWNKVSVHPSDDHTLIESEIPPVAFADQLPVSATEQPEGWTVYDFGVEVVGYLVLVASAEAGKMISIRHGEELLSNGRVAPMRCNCKYDEVWTLSGNSSDRLEYTDYKAFRYIELLPENDVKIESVSVVMRNYPVSERHAEFKCDDNLLQQIWNICTRAITVSSQTGFLDCPSREKGQYLGDLTVTAHAHLLFSADSRLYQKALRDFADSSFICPGLMAVAPGNLMQEIADYSLQYPQQLYTYYQYTGDINSVRSLFEYAQEMMDYFKKYERTDGLLENVKEKWNLVDWPENLRDGYDFQLTPRDPGVGPHAVLNAFYASAKRHMNHLREILGKPTEQWETDFNAAFLTSFYDKEKHRIRDSESTKHTAFHSNVMALYAGLVPENAVDSIVQFIMQKGLCCGVYMAYFVLKALTRVGRHDCVYKLLVNQSEHSWANMIREGATACFEAWGKEQKWNTSLCHPWASAPVPVIIEDLIGLYPQKSGYRCIGLRPTFNANNPDFSLTVNLPTARVSIVKHVDELNVDITTTKEDVSILIESPFSNVSESVNNTSENLFHLTKDKQVRFVLRCAQ